MKYLIVIGLLLTGCADTDSYYEEAKEKYIKAKEALKKADEVLKRYDMAREDG